MAMAIGQQAPDFELRDDSGTTHRLNDQRGRWVVLYFYPKDDTPGCTVEACEFRDANDELLARNAVVWGVSPQGATSKQRFRSKYALPFDLLADEDHAVADAYGAWEQKSSYGKLFRGTSRKTFLIDPQGRIAHVWEKVRPAGHAADVMSTIDRAKGTAASPA